MKLRIFLLFTLLPYLCTAQDWKLFNSNYQYNYQTDTSNYISHTILADSVKVINGDSIFYLNKIVKDCFTCDPNEPHKYKIGNQGQFLQKEITKSADGVYRFLGDTEFFINPYLEVGSFWTFDTTQNSLATIEMSYEEEIFGLTDSVKFISTENGDQILISKNYGILSFETSEDAYELVGIGGLGVGELLPTKADIYDFNVGSVFQYRSWNGGLSTTLKTTRKWLITDKTENDSQFVYTIYEIKNQILSDFFSSDTSSHDYSFEHTIEKRIQNSFDYESFIENYYPNMLVQETYYDEEFKVVKIRKDIITDAIFISKDLIVNQHIGTESTYSFVNATDTLLLNENSPEQTKIIYAKCTGEVIQAGSLIDNSSLVELIGYVKNGDTIGIVTADEDLLVATSELQITNNIKVSPTISDGIYNIMHTDGSKLNFNLFDVSGKLVFSEENTVGTINQVDIRREKAGVYFLRILSDEKFQTIRLVKY